MGIPLCCRVAGGRGSGGPALTLLSTSRVSLGRSSGFGGVFSLCVRGSVAGGGLLNSGSITSDVSRFTLDGITVIRGNG